MGPLSLALLSALAAQPPVVVLPTQTTAVTTARATAIAERVARTFRDEGVVLSITPTEAAVALRAAGASDPTECRGEPTCVARLGTLLGVQLVVGVGVAEFEGSVALHLEVVRTSLAGAPLVDDQLLPADLADPLWSRALAPFAWRLFQPAAVRPPARGAEGPAPPRTPSPRSAPSLPPPRGAWVFSIEGSSELGAFGGLGAVRAGRAFFPDLTVSVGALVTGSALLGASVQMRAVPFGSERWVRPIIAMEVPVFFRSPLGVGLRPSAGAEASLLEWLWVGANVSYLLVLGAPPEEVRPSYWLGGVEVGFRL